MNRVDPLVLLPFAVEQYLTAEDAARRAKVGQITATRRKAREARAAVTAIIGQATTVALDVERVAHLEVQADAGRRTHRAGAGA